MMNDIAKKLGFRTPDGIHCVHCGQPYSAKNVFTAAGWRETRLSGFCERCFDALPNDV